MYYCPRVCAVCCIVYLLCIIGKYLLTFDSIKLDVSSDTFFGHEKIRKFITVKTLFIFFTFYICSIVSCCCSAHSTVIKFIVYYW